jgi:16S rRNA (cytosine1402-N4)-methyltransferase
MSIQTAQPQLSRLDEPELAGRTASRRRPSRAARRLVRSMIMTSAPHIPVLREEAIAALGVHRGGRYIDATFGAGGYTRAIMAAETRAAFDRDQTA